MKRAKEIWFWCRRNSAAEALTMLGVGGLSLYYGTDEALEGRNAFVEKRPPDFGRFRT